jgi:hypothetical protein
LLDRIYGINRISLEGEELGVFRELSAVDRELKTAPKNPRIPQVPNNN